MRFYGFQSSWHCSNWSLSMGLWKISLNTPTSKGTCEMKPLNEIRSGRPVLARSFAVSHGLRVGQVIHYCRTGKIAGARFDRELWQWVVYPPFKLLIGWIKNAGIGANPSDPSVIRSYARPAFCQGLARRKQQKCFMSHTAQWTTGNPGGFKCLMRLLSFCTF